MENQNLYEDNHIIIINKLPGEIVQGDKTGDMPLSEKVKLYLKNKYNKPGNVFVGVTHRIDRPVSGIVVFAKTSKALSRLNKMFKENNIKKTYLAVCGNAPPDNIGILKNHLIKDQNKNKSFVKSVAGKNTKEAILEYRLVSSSKSFFLLEIDLQTGRHHQIRVQLAHIGCPIRGDLKYGFTRSNKDGGINLHAATVEFIHPVSGNLINIKASPPNDSVWEYFEYKYI